MIDFLVIGVIKPTVILHSCCVAVIMVGFVEQMYTFVESQVIGIIQVRKDAVSDEQFMVRVLGGES